jgi:hypothetical protein
MRVLFGEAEMFTLRGANAYRLGYVSGDFTHYGAKFREEVYSQAGEFADNGAWRCGEMVQQLEQGKANY